MNYILLILGIILVVFGLVLFQGSSEQLDDLNYHQKNSLTVDSYLGIKHSIERSMIVSTGGIIVGIVLSIAGVLMKPDSLEKVRVMNQDDEHT